MPRAAAKPSATFEPRDEGGVASVERALTILESLLNAGGRASLAAIADGTGLYKSTILRLIASLEAFGYVQRTAEGDYELGHRLFELGNVYARNFRLEAQITPVLRDIVARTEESASFYVRAGDHRLVMLREDCALPVRDVVRVGDRLPLDRGAGGHVLTRFEAGAAARRARSAADFAIGTLGERQADTAAVAAPVFGRDGSLVGAIGVSGPRTRFEPARLRLLRRVVLESARALTARLGGPADAFPSFSAIESVDRKPRTSSGPKRRTA